MNISAACLPPRHAPVFDSDRQHPRFAEYQRYRSAMSAQLVECPPFSAWLGWQEDYELGRRTVFQAGPKCNQRTYIVGKWYVGITPPNGGEWYAEGPFDTKDEAERLAP